MHLLPAELRGLLEAQQIVFGGRHRVGNVSPPSRRVFERGGQGGQERPPYGLERPAARTKGATKLSRAPIVARHRRAEGAGVSTPYHRAPHAGTGAFGYSAWGLALCPCRHSTAGPRGGGGHTGAKPWRRNTHRG